MTSAQVEQFLHQLNEAWLNQDYEALSSLYHADVVLLPPDIGDPIEGRDAVFDAYRDFHTACTVNNFEITEHRSWAPTPTTTMVHMRFAIDYQLHRLDASTPTPAAQSEQGLEVYTLAENPQGQNTIVWRAQFAL